MKTLESLLPKLILWTEQGKISWTDSILDGYEADVSAKHKVRVWEWVDEDNGDPGASVVLSHNSGSNNYGSGTIDIVVASRYSDLNEIVSKVLLTARRSANKVDDVINQIEDFIDNGR